MYDFYKKQQVYKIVNGEIEKTYKNGDPKIYTVETVSKDGVKLYNVPHVFFNHDGEVETVDSRKTKKKNVIDSSLWQIWQNSKIKPVGK